MKRIGDQLGDTPPMKRDNRPSLHISPAKGKGKKKLKYPSPKATISLPKCKGKFSYFDASSALCYGYKVMSKHTEENFAIELCCMFCETFGKEVSASVKRQRKKKTYMCSGPKFRKDALAHHHETCHPKRWKEFIDLRRETNDDFPQLRAFFGAEQNQKTLPEMFESADRHALVNISPSIVNCVRDVYLNSFGQEVIEEDQTTVQGILRKMFKYDEHNGDGTTYQLKVTRYNLLFEVARLVSCGLSFSEVSKIYSDEGRIVHNHSFNMSREDVTTIVRQIFALNLQFISMILEECVGFSIGVDGGNNPKSQLLSVRLRVFYRNNFLNLHFIAIPANFSHTGQNMADCVMNCLGAVCENWREKLIGISSDGAKNMTGCVNGFVAAIQRNVPHSLFRSWCGLHQLDLSVQKMIDKLYVRDLLMDETTLEWSLTCKPFMTKLYLIITKINRNKKFCSEVLKSQCPRHVPTRWLSLGKLLDWLVCKMHLILPFLKRDDFISENQLDCYFWIEFHCLHRVIQYVNDVVERLQNHLITKEEQTTILMELRQNLMSLGKATEASQGPRTIASMDKRDSFHFIVSCVPKRVFTEALKDEDGQLNIQDLPTPTFESIRAMICFLADSIIEQCSPESEGFAQDDQLPPVNPSEYQKMGGESFMHLLNRYAKSDAIVRLEEELIIQYQTFYHWGTINSVVLTNITEAISSPIEMWQKLPEKIRKRIPLLIQFVMTLATVMPNTASVESDFSIVKFQIGNHRHNLTTLTLDGILHCKQFEKHKKMFMEMFFELKEIIMANDS